MIMRNVNSGWLIRYLHSNGAGFFFIFVYIHMAKALYYGSYRAPRVLLWSIGVVIFLVMIITAFLGITETCLKWLNMEEFILNNDAPGLRSYSLFNFIFWKNLLRKSLEPNLRPPVGLRTEAG